MPKAFGLPVQSLLQRLPLKYAWHTATACVLGLAAVFGGLDAVSPMTPVSVGKPYTNGPLVITTKGAFIVCSATQVPPAVGYLPVKPNTNRFAVATTVENTADSDFPIPDNVESVFEMKTDAGSRFEGAYAVSGYSATTSIAPGITKVLTLVWSTVHRPLSAEEEIILRIRNQRWYQRFFTPTEGWGDTGEYGELHIKVKGC